MTLTEKINSYRLNLPINEQLEEFAECGRSILSEIYSNKKVFFFGVSEYEKVEPREAWMSSPFMRIVLRYYIDYSVEDKLICYFKDLEVHVTLDGVPFFLKEKYTSQIIPLEKIKKSET